MDCCKKGKRCSRPLYPPLSILPTARKEKWRDADSYRGHHGFSVMLDVFPGVSAHFKNCLSKS